MPMFPSFPPRRRKICGYTLTESAIVLGVIGIILGALWGAAATAWKYTQLEQAREVIAATVGNARSYFSGQAGVPSTGYANLTSQLITANVIPNSLKRGALCAGLSCADQPLGGGVADANGSFRVCYWSIGNPNCTAAPPAGGFSPFFGVVVTQLSVKNCIALVETMSSATEPTGLVEININGTNQLAAGNVIQPISDAVVLAACNAAANTATFVYRVVSPGP
jgi:type II secretory pathway pseudopilin PulG